MDSLISALEDGRPGLASPWPSLSRVIAPRPGTLMIVLGAPGVGKSMFMLAWSLLAGYPSRIVSLDTDPLTQAARTVSCLSGVPQEVVMGDGLAEADRLATRAKWAQWLRERNLPVRVLEVPLRAEELSDLLVADREYFGQSPSLVVVDDVSKLSIGDRGYTEFDKAFFEMHRAARRQGTVVAAIHHLHRGDASAGDKPIRLNDGKYTGEYEGEIVLGIWQPQPGLLRISVLKNRYGKGSGNGSLYVDFNVNMDTVQFQEPQLVMPRSVLNPELAEFGHRMFDG